MAEILREGMRGEAVIELQRLLRVNGLAVTATGEFDAETEAAVLEVQRRSGLVRDGLVGGKTRLALLGDSLDKLLTENDLTHVAAMLDVPLASIKAVNEVESAGRGFMLDGRPAILFERHVFNDRLLAYGQNPAPHVRASPDLVNPKRGGYAGGAAEWTRMARASEIHRPAALESASWGQFQIMGYHWRRLGYDGIVPFVSALHQTEREHLEAFVRFILADKVLHQALQARRWAQFASIYNGPAYAEHKYDVRLAQAVARYDRLAQGANP